METINVLVEGGKASAGPPLGPKLGPLGINIGEVVNQINEKTKDMAGIQVPVIVKVDAKTKEFTIEVGQPSTASLIKKELKLTKGAANRKLPVADMSIDRAIKIAKIKKEGLLSFNLKSAVKEILGSCRSLGVLVEGKDPKEIQKEVDQGKYDKKISGEEELTLWDEQKIEARKAELQKVIKQKVEATKPKEEEKSEKPKEEKPKEEKKESKK